MQQISPTFVACLCLAALSSQPAAAESGPEIVNQVRSRLGLSLLQEDLRLTQAAQKHAQYLSVPENQSHGHFQLPGALFTARTPSERCRAVGVAGGCSEVLFVGGSSTRDAIDTLMKGPFHRALLLDPRAQGYGIGVAGLPNRKGLHSYVVNMVTNPDLQQAPLVAWPDDESGFGPVPPIFMRGDELPDPLPVNMEQSGYLISLHGLVPISVDSWQLKAEDGAALSTKILIPDPASGRTILLAPLVPLLPGKRYKIAFSGTYGDKPVSKHWSFTTRASIRFSGLAEGQKLAKGEEVSLHVSTLSGVMSYSHSCFELLESNYASLKLKYIGEDGHGPTCYVKIGDPHFPKANVVINVPQS